jgi:hypothetical protein
MSYRNYIVGACFFHPLSEVISDLQKYEKGFKIEIRMVGDAIRKIYPELVFHDFGWARRFLKPMIWVTENNKFF